MAVSYTARLRLAKYVAGDPDWDVGLNAGMDNADARLLQISSDHGDGPDPNTGGAAPVVGHFVGQLYIDETVDPPRVWLCTTAADPASVWDLISSDSIELSSAVSTETILQDCLEALQTRIVTMEDALAIPPRGMIDGLTLSRETIGAPGDAIGITVGEAADSSKTRYLERSAFWEKGLDDWASGDQAGGISGTLWTADSDQVVNHKWYHVFLVWDSGNGHDVAFDSAVDGANLVTDGWTYLRRIGAWKATAAGVVRRFLQFGDYFVWHDPTEDDLFYAGQNIANNTPTNIVAVAPLGVHCLAQINWSVNDVSDKLRFYAYSPDVQDQTPNPTKGLAQIYTHDSIGDKGATTAFYGTDLLSQVRYQVNCAASPVDWVYAATLGYMDPRGRNL